MTEEQKKVKSEVSHKIDLGSCAGANDSDVWDWLAERDKIKYEKLLIEAGRTNREDFE